MASKKPSMPAPVVVYTPAPAEPADKDTTATDTTDKDKTTAPEVTEDEQRLQNILNRRRGRLGTIATSFSGVLSNENSLAPTRKTLLGE